MGAGSDVQELDFTAEDAKKKMLKRKENWPEALADFFMERRLQTFAWGVNDCCLFVCDAVLAMTGTDVASAFRGKYDSMGASARVAKKILGVDLKSGVGVVEQIANAIAARFDIPEVPLLMAQRGDVVIFDGELGGTLGVVSMHGHTVVSVSPGGTVEIPIGECRRAWRIS